MAGYYPPFGSEVQNCKNRVSISCGCKADRHDIDLEKVEIEKKIKFRVSYAIAARIGLRQFRI